MITIFRDGHNIFFFSQEFYSPQMVHTINTVHRYDNKHTPDSEIDVKSYTVALMAMER